VKEPTEEGLIFDFSEREPIVDARDVDRVVAAVLSISGITQPQPETFESLYGHLSQCILAAVFSVGVDAENERNVVRRYTAHAHLVPPYRRGRQDYRGYVQQPLANFLADASNYQHFADNIVHNHNLTSTTGTRILKAEAAFHWGSVLYGYRIQTLQDAMAAVSDRDIERALLRIPGQTREVSLAYFYMLIGREDFVKQERWVGDSFLGRVLGRKAHAGEALPLFRVVSALLIDQYPHLTPRQLDLRIWEHERVAHKRGKR
jgi:hypothetical protein